MELVTFLSLLHKQRQQQSHNYPLHRVRNWERRKTLRMGYTFIGLSHNSLDSCRTKTLCMGYVTGNVARPYAWGTLLQAFYTTAWPIVSSTLCIGYVTGNVTSHHTSGTTFIGLLHKQLGQLFTNPLHRVCNWKRRTTHVVQPL